jgi:hypothetical protein
MKGFATTSLSTEGRLPNKDASFVNQWRSPGDLSRNSRRVSGDLNGTFVALSTPALTDLEVAVPCLTKRLRSARRGDRPHEAGDFRSIVSTTPT